MGGVTPLEVRQYVGNQLTRRSPRRGPVAVRNDGAKESAPKAAVHTSSIVVSANCPSFIKSISMPIPIPAGPRNVVGPPTPGRVSGSGHIPGRVRPSPQTHRGSGPALFACDNPARGVNRTSTQLYRVRTRSRLRVSFPLVAGSRGSTGQAFSKSLLSRQRRTPEARITPTCHWGPGAHPPS